MNLQEVKQRITDLREKHGMSKKELGDAVGVNPSYVSQVENLKDGQKPSIEFLWSLRDHFNISIDHILGGNENFSIGKNTFMNINMHTETAKKALEHLAACAKNLKKLDKEAYFVINKLQNETEILEDPTISNLVHTL